MATRSHIALATLPLLALAGCMQTEEQIGFSNRMHTQIVAEETTAELKIDTVVAGEKLGAFERDAVKSFATAYQQEGHGAVIISRPSNGPDDISAIRAAADAASCVTNRVASRAATCSADCADSCTATLARACEPQPRKANGQKCFAQG